MANGPMNLIKYNYSSMNLTFYTRIYKLLYHICSPTTPRFIDPLKDDEKLKTTKTRLIVVTYHIHDQSIHLDLLIINVFVSINNYIYWLIEHLPTVYLEFTKPLKSKLNQKVSKFSKAKHKLLIIKNSLQFCTIKITSNKYSSYVLSMYEYASYIYSIN